MVAKHHKQVRQHNNMNDPLQDSFTKLNFDNMDFAPQLADDHRTAMQEASNEYVELAKAFEKTFSTPSGKKVMKHLKELTLERCTWQPDVGMNVAIPTGFAREGQNALMRNILALIEQGKQAHNLPKKDK